MRLDGTLLRLLMSVQFLLETKTIASLLSFKLADLVGRYRDELGYGQSDIRFVMLGFRWDLF